MKKLATKIQEFNPGKKIFLSSSGAFEISEAMELPSWSVLGAEIPSQEGLYFLSGSTGSFIVKVGLVIYVWKSATEIVSYDGGNEESILTPLFTGTNSETNWRGQPSFSYTSDKGFAFAICDDTGTIYLKKVGDNGNYEKTIDLTSLSPAAMNPLQTPAVIGLQAEENHWVFAVMFTVTLRDALYIMKIGYDTAPDTVKYIGDGANDLPTAMDIFQPFTEDWFSDKLRKIDGGYIYLYGRWGYTFVKLNNNLEYLYHYEDLEENYLYYFDYVDAEDGNIQVYPTYYSISIKDNLIYSIATSFSYYENDDEWYWDIYISVFEDTGTSIEHVANNRLYVSKTLDAFSMNLGWKEYYSYVLNEDKLYATGVIWSREDPPSLNHHGKTTIAVDLNTLDLLWETILWDDDSPDFAQYGVQGYSITYLRDQVYSAGVVERVGGGEALENVTAYDSETGAIVDRIIEVEEDFGYFAAVINTDTKLPN